jgi:hypothetical protein
MANEEILKITLDAGAATANLNQLQSEIAQLAAEKRKLAKQEKELTKAVQEGNDLTDEQLDSLRDISEQQVENNRVLKETKQEYKANEDQIIRNNKAQKSNTGSLAEMRAELARDQQAYIKLSKEERENEKVGGVLQKRIKSQSDELKDLEKEIGITSRSVGDYGQAVTGVLPLMGGFGQQIQAVLGNLGQVKDAVSKFSAAQKGMVASTKATNGSLKAFRLALISTGIGAIVVLLGTLIAAFLSTQRGVDGVTKVLRPLQEIFASLLGVVQDLATKGFDRIKKAIADPKQAFEDFGNFIKDQFITRVLAIPKAFIAINKLIINSVKLLGVGIKNAVKDVPLLGRLVDKESIDKDLKEAKEAVAKSFKDLTDAQIELAIGVDADKVREAGAKAGEFFAEAAARGSEIDKLTKEIEIANISLNREREKANRLFQEQKEIAQNTLLTDQERLKAAANAKAILAEVTALEGNQLDRQIKLAKLKTEANDTDREAQTEIQDLIAEKERVEAAAISKRIELGNQANGIVKARIALNKKEAEEQEKAAQKKIEDDKKLATQAIDKRIEMLNLERQLELATIDETNEEKLQKERELLDEIGALRVEKAKINGEDVSRVELENQIATAEIAQEQQSLIDERQATALASFEDTKQSLRDKGEEGLRRGIDFTAEKREEKRKEELDRLKTQLDSGLISQDEFEKKRLQLERKSFADKKKRDLAIIAIDLAKEISSISAAAAANPANALTFGAAGISQAAILSAIAVARSGVQAGIIASQKFAQGGVIHGASHAQGGVPVNVGGSGMIEAEGGEAIINKKSTRR